MDARTYEKRRNELVGLIDKALALGTIPAKTGNALKAGRRKVYENQFRIVLVSGFECGKSTTFNIAQNIVTYLVSLIHYQRANY